jgi:hypothetical protein
VALDGVLANARRLGYLGCGLSAKLEQFGPQFCLSHAGTSGATF